MSDTEPENPPRPNASGSAAVVSQAHGHRFVPSNFPVPQAMVCKGDKASNWEFFRRQYEDYEIATNSVSSKCQFAWLPFVRLWEKNIYKFLKI